MTITREQVLRNGRHAGEVRRWHTWPMHTVQTVADHSWNIARIYFSIWGPLPPEVSTYIIWHDAGELVLGDLPFPIKSRLPLLKEICDKVERYAVLDMGGHLPELPEQEKLRVKCADLIDMFELGLVELQMGNRYGQPIVDDISKNLEKLLEKASSWDKALVHQYVCATSKALEA